MASFDSGVIETLQFHDGNDVGTKAFCGGGVTVWGAFLLIVS